MSVIERVFAWIRQHVRGPLVAFILLFVATLYIFAGDQTNACNRLNIVRAQSNIGNSVSFNILSNSGRREQALAKSSRTPEMAKIHRESADGLLGQAQRLTVTALTDCGNALNPRYNYPLAGPIGDPADGTLAPEAAKIIRESEAAVEAHSSDVKGTG